MHAFDRLGGVGSERDFVDRTILKHMILPQPLKCWDYICATMPNSNKQMVFSKNTWGFFFPIVFEITLWPGWPQAPKAPASVSK